MTQYTVPKMRKRKYQVYEMAIGETITVEGVSAKMAHGTLGHVRRRTGLRFSAITKIKNGQRRVAITRIA